MAKLNAQMVRVTSCRAGSFNGRRGSERAALLTFSHNHQFVGPFALQLSQVAILIRDLQQVLDDWSNTTYAGIPVGNDQSSSEDVPPDPIKATGASLHASPKFSRLVKPSRRANTSKYPISPKEALIFRHLLKNVKSHHDFLRFIGADVAIDATADSLSDQPLPQKRDRARTGKQNQTKRPRGKHRKTK